MKKAASPAQIAARKLFAARAKAGAFAKTGVPSKRVRDQAKADYAQRAERMKSERRKNPLTRVKVSSPSMLTKKPPTKRLKARRSATNKAPAGYYANPVEKKIKYRGGISIPFAPYMFGFCVEQKDGADWIEIAGFRSSENAFDYARALSRRYPGATLRVSSAGG